MTDKILPANIGTSFANEETPNLGLEIGDLTTQIPGQDFPGEPIISVFDKYNNNFVKLDTGVGDSLKKSENLSGLTDEAAARRNLGVVPSTGPLDQVPTNLMRVGDYAQRVITGTVAQYSSPGTGHHNIRVRLPYKLTSNAMISFDVVVYSGYLMTRYRFSGYLYADINHWYLPRAYIEGHPQPADPVFGVDGEGYAYVNIQTGSYPGVSVCNVVLGHHGYPVVGVGDGWQITNQEAGAGTLTGTITTAYHTDNLPTTATRWPVWSEVSGKPEFGSAATADVVGDVWANGIIASGSNASGDYVRYADGTQICWGFVDLPATPMDDQAEVSAPYAAEFSEVPRTTFSPVAQLGAGSANDIGLTAYNGTYTGNSTVSFILRSWTYRAATGSPVRYHFTAFGKFK